MATYSEVTSPDLQARVRERYDREIAALRLLGFRPLAFTLESLGPFSAVFQLPILILALFKREVLVIAKPLRMAVANAILLHPELASIALCMGMGIKIYTAFSDSSLLISSDFKTYAVPRPGSSITRLLPAATLDETWAAHRERALAMVSEARSIVPGGSFQSYVAMSLREEDLSQYA